MLNCLWLARTLPFPENSGDRVYSGKTATALAAAGMRVTYVGLAGEAPPEPAENVTWHVVPGAPRGQLRALLSPNPLVAARFAIQAYRAELAALAGRQPWDVVVMDQYGMGWVIAARHLFGAHAPTFVFFTHDHEESVTLGQSRDGSLGLVKRLFLMQNHLKARWFERRAARGAALITTITQDDADLFAHTAPGVPRLVLTPGFDGPRMPVRQIDATVPRAAVLYGSFRWSAKQANLRQFLEAAAGRMVEAGITLRIVGDMSEAFRSDMQTRFPAVEFTGFVEDPAPYLDARLAIVAEPIGGGFKMKMLEYVFRRIPVVALQDSIGGLPDSVRCHVLAYPDLTALAEGALAVIDDTERLDRLQRGAFDAARTAFDWPDRGAALRDAITAVASPRPPAPPSLPALPRRAHVPVREEI